MMDRRTPRMTHPAVVTTVAIVLVALCTPSAHAQELANEAFRIQYDESGIRSLRRAKDVHDTDYIAANGRLGRFPSVQSGMTAAAVLGWFRCPIPPSPTASSPANIARKASTS